MIITRTLGRPLSRLSFLSRRPLTFRVPSHPFSTESFSQTNSTDSQFYSNPQNLYEFSNKELVPIYDEFRRQVYTNLVSRVGSNATRLLAPHENTLRRHFEEKRPFYLNDAQNQIYARNIADEIFYKLLSSDKLQEDADRKLEKLQTLTDSVNKDRFTPRHHTPKGRKYQFNPSISTVVGEFVYVPLNDVENTIPEGLQGRVDLEELSDDFPFMFRTVFSEVADALAFKQKNRFLFSANSPILIDGSYTCGKTFLLNILVYWARTNGWLVVYVSGQQLVNSGYIVPSLSEPDNFDEPPHALVCLESVRKVHGELLTSLPCKLKYSFGNFSTLDKKRSLLDLVNFGIDNQHFIGECFNYFRRELNLVTEVPVLLVVDDYNVLHGDSDFFDPLVPVGDVKLPAQRLTMVKRVSNAKHHGLVNGTVLCAMTNNHKNTDCYTEFEKNNIFTVGPYNLEEMGSYSHHKKNTEEIHMSLEKQKYLLTLTQGIPTEVNKYYDFMG